VCQKHSDSNLAKSDDDADDDQDQPDQGQAENQQHDFEPQTRAQLNLLRSREKNTSTLVNKFLQDNNLQIKLRIMLIPGKIYRLDHVNMLSKMSEGNAGMIEFYSDRAAFGAFQRTIIPLLQCADVDANMSFLGLQPSCTPPHRFDMGIAWFREEVSHLHCLRKFTSSLSANLVWLEAMFFTNFPSKCPITLHTSEQERTLGLAWMRCATDAIVEAETLVSAEPNKYTALKGLLEEVGFLDEQFPREVMATGRKEGWQDNPGSELCKTGKFIASGSATTTDCLEKSFGHVHDKIKLNSKSKQMSIITKWYYLGTSPFTENGGMETLKTTRQQYMQSSGAIRDLVCEAQQAASSSYTQQLPCALAKLN
jgi:hypothetical protein